MKERNRETENQRTSDTRTARRIPLCLSLFRCFAVSLFLSLIWASALPATPPPAKPATPLTLRWEPGTYHLGDLVPFEISVPLPSREFYVEGDLTEGAEWGDAVIAKVRQELPAAYPGTLVLRGQVQVFAVGTAVLPPLSIGLHLADTVRFYAVKAPPLSIAPLLPPGDQPRPPIAPPMAVSAPWPWLWTVLALAGLVLLGSVAYLLRRRRRDEQGEPRAKPELKEVDPDRWIVEEIDRIFREPAPASVRYQRLSEALREYLAIKLGMPFPDWTTTEVADGLSQTPGMTEAALAEPLRLLAFCDVIMFARYVPQTQEERDAREIALEFVHAVRERPELEAAS